MAVLCKTNALSRRNAARRCVPMGNRALQGAASQDEIIPTTKRLAERINFVLRGTTVETGFCENCTAYKDSDGYLQSEKSCLEFCCGTCTSRYCCSNLLQKLDEDDQVMCNEMSER
ncbi:UNVERIFIED_CONTAM: hypothetical protein K2H54_045268 [Gekko kuhli]